MGLYCLESQSFQNLWLPVFCQIWDAFGHISKVSFFSLYSFPSFPETPLTDVRDTGAILTLGPLSQFSSLLFTLDNFYWSIHLYFWLKNSRLDLLYHFYFPIEIVHLSTHFKIVFLLGILYSSLKIFTIDNRICSFLCSTLACVSWFHVGIYKLISCCLV